MRTTVPTSSMAIALLLVCGTATAQVDPHIDAARVTDIVSSADHVVIEALNTGVAVHEAKSDVDDSVHRVLARKVVTGVEDLRSFAALLALTDEELRPGEEIEEADGKKVIVHPICYCVGDYRCRVFKDSMCVVEFTIHHGGEFIRIRRTLVSEFDVKPECRDRLRSFLQTPEKEANQALQTTSVTPVVFEKVSVSDRQRRGV